MKLQRYTQYLDYDMKPIDSGQWVKSSDAEILEKKVQELEGLLSENAERLTYWKETAQRLRTRSERATANMVHAQNYAAELEKGLQEIVDSICCDVEDMGVKPTQCAHCIAKKYLEGK